MDHARDVSQTSSAALNSALHVSRISAWRLSYVLVSALTVLALQVNRRR